MVAPVHCALCTVQYRPVWLPNVQWWHAFFSGLAQHLQSSPASLPWAQTKEHLSSDYSSQTLVQCSVLSPARLQAQLTNRATAQSQDIQHQISGKKPAPSVTQLILTNMTFIERFHDNHHFGRRDHSV